MNNAQLQGIRMTHEAMTAGVAGRTMTAREMALTAHNVSRSGDLATTADGSVFVWDRRFSHWALWKKAPAAGK